MKEFHKPKLYYNGENTYIQVPRLIFNPPFQDMSDSARILYGLLLDRIELSYQSPDRWKDDNDVYIYFQREEVAQILHVDYKTATKLFNELESAGLIERKRREFGRPARIYIGDYCDESGQTPPHTPGVSRMRGPKRRMTSFINVPWALFQAPYTTLSDSARILYGLLNKRMNNEKWYDTLKEDSQSAYIYYRKWEIMATLNVGEHKAVKVIKELENVGLIERNKQGFGKPAKIRIKLPETPVETDAAHKGKNDTSHKGKNDTSHKGKNDTSHKGKNDTSHKGKNDTTTFYNTYSSLPRTPLTESINPQSGEAAAPNPARGESAVGLIQPKECVNQAEATNISGAIDEDPAETYKPFFRENLWYEQLVKEFPPSEVDELINLIAEECADTSKTMRIGGKDCPRHRFKARMIKMTRDYARRILYALEQVDPATIHNRRAYLITMCYNYESTNYTPDE